MQVVAKPVEQVSVARAGLAARWMVILDWSLLAIGLVALQLWIPHDKFADGEVRFQELALLLDHGVLSPQRYSLIGPIFSAPLYLLGHLYSSPARWTVRYNSLLFSLSLLAVYWVLRTRIDRALLRTFLLILVAASMFPAHVSSYYGETFTVVCVAVGLLIAEFAGPLLGWSAVVLGVANTSAALAGLLVIVARRVYETGRWRYVLAIAATAAVMGGENWIRRGSPFATAYESGFDNPIIFGLLGILLSFGKGLIFFVPGMFLPLKRLMLGAGDTMRRLYSVHLLWISFVVGLVLLYANWYGWDGGWYWGPRFFLIASFPASLALAVRLRTISGALGANLLTLGAFALSTWADINGAVYNMTALAPICLKTGRLDLCDYMLPLSPLWHPFFDPQHLTLANVLFIAYCSVVFVYLALPTVRVTLSQLADVLHTHVHVGIVPRM